MLTMKPHLRQSKGKRSKRNPMGQNAPASGSSQTSEPVVALVPLSVSQDVVVNATASLGHTVSSSVDDVRLTKGVQSPGGVVPEDYFNKLSLEIICHILSYLPLRDVVRLESLSQKMQEAITMHLRLLREIDFTEGEIYSWMCTGFTDTTFAKFLARCPDVANIYGVHMRSIAKRRQRVSEHLSIPGIITALSICCSLYGVETSDIFLLEAITNYLPYIHILRTFRNRDGTFPLFPCNRFELDRNPRITTLYLTGVVIPQLPRMDFLQHLYLKWVKLTDSHPFTDFGVPLLRTFVMNNCAGPTNALKYVPLITGLAGARSLSRLELVRVPFLGGLIQHVVEDSWRMHGFRQLAKVVFGTCKHALEVDLGYMVITCAHRLEELAVQPSLTKDSLFSSLTLADVEFPHFETLHLGYVDEFPEHGKWTNEQLVKHGLADINESPAMITDIGMRAVGQVFSQVKAVTIYNCPHLHLPMSWFTPVGSSWQRLKDLHLRRCHAVRLNDFCRMIPLLPNLESLYLEQMFREPPKGCSRVGLSAGTGLGVSSALVQNSGNDVANQDPANNNPPVVPVNPIPNPQPVPAPVPPPPLNPEHNAEEEMEVSDSDYEAPPQGDPPFDQLLDPLAEGRHPIVDHVSGDLTGAHGPGMGMDLDDAGALQSRKLQAAKSDKADGEPTPGTSSGDNADKQTSNSKCQCARIPLNSNNKQRRSSSPPHPSSSSAALPRGRVIQPTRGRLKPTLSGSNLDAEDTSPTRRSKRLRLSHGSSPTSCSSSVNSSSSSSANTSSLDLRAVSACGKTYTGKGKSLRGRKKGLVKHTAHSANPASEAREVKNKNQSCQAISEEIRETTKKAKEEEASRKTIATDNKVPSSVAQVSVGSSTCPIHSRASVIVGLPPTAAQPHNSPATPSLPDQDRLPPAHLTDGGESDSAVASPSLPGLDSGRERRTMSTQTGSRGPSKVAHDLGRKNVSRKPHMCDQATSTSDPVIEEDHIQVLEVCSSSLISLTLRQVGVTDLTITACPKLQLLAGTACRVLKYVTVKDAPKLYRVQFAQCRKLRHDRLIDQISKQTPDTNRLILLRPMQMYDPVVVERHLMASPDYNYNMCLVQDYCANPELTLYNRIRATSWLDIMMDINRELLSKENSFVKANRAETSKPAYPWGRHIYKMQGESEGGYWWDLVTDMPWLRPLASVKGATTQTLPEQERKAGLYNPRLASHGDLDVCLRALREDISEARESGMQLYAHNVLVYVNMCDLYGPPVTDRYL